MKQLTQKIYKEATHKYQTGLKTSEQPICGYLSQHKEFGLRINIRRDKVEGVCSLTGQNCHRKMPSGNPEECFTYQEVFFSPCGYVRKTKGIELLCALTGRKCNQTILLENPEECETYQKEFGIIDGEYPRSTK